MTPLTFFFFERRWVTFRGSFFPQWVSSLGGGVTAGTPRPVLCTPRRRTRTSRPSPSFLSFLSWRGKSRRKQGKHRFSDFLLHRLSLSRQTVHTARFFLMPHTGVPSYLMRQDWLYIAIGSGHHGSCSLLLLKYFSRFSFLDNCSFCLYLFIYCFASGLRR